MVRRRGLEGRTQRGLEVAENAFLIDTSAWSRSTHPAVRDRIGGLVLAGRAATCGVVELELLFSARGPSELDEARAARARNVRLVAMEQIDFDRAADVLADLAKRGLHRAVGIADLLIAACAERSDLTLLHYDSDYEHVASVTRQPTDWVAPRGSLP